MAGVFAFTAVGASWISYNSGLEMGQKISTDTKVLASSSRIGPQSIVKNQNALAVGVITESKDNSITVQADNGEQTTFKLSSKIIIYTISTSSAKPAPPSSNVSDIRINEKALIDLQLQGEDYLVTNISYMPTGLVKK